MAVLVYKRNWDTGQYRLVQEFGPEAGCVKQRDGDLYVMPANGERPLLVIAHGRWDACLVDRGQGATRIEARPTDQASASGRAGLASAM
ncbi:MAG: hypothetical protein ACT4QF_07060 [Sporichthyaceae bacterium]